MDYNSKNIRAAVKFFSVELDQTFLKVHAETFVIVTWIGEVMGRKRLPTLRKLSFKFRHWNSVIEGRYLNYTNNWYNNKHTPHSVAHLGFQRAGVQTLEKGQTIYKTKRNEYTSYIGDNFLIIRSYKIKYTYDCR